MPGTIAELFAKLKNPSSFNVPNADEQAANNTTSGLLDLMSGPALQPEVKATAMAANYPAPQTTFPKEQTTEQTIADYLKNEESRSKAALEPYLKEQKGGIDQLRDIMALKAQQPAQLDLSPLAALSDSLSGGKLLQGYQKPVSNNQLANEQISSFNELQQRKSDLTKAAKPDSNSHMATLLALLGRQDAKTEKGVETFSKRTEILPTLKYSMDQLDSALSKVPEGKDIPGIGPYVSKVPGFFLSPDGRNIRQHAMDLVTAKIYLTTGKQVNEREAETALKSIGMGIDSTQLDFKKGYDNLKRSIYGELKQKEAGYKPEVIDEARKRGALTTSDFHLGGQENSGWTKEKEEKLQRLKAKQGK